MRTPSGNYELIAEALLPYQRKTLEDYAAARGIPRSEWWRQPLCAVMAASLAVSNELQNLSDSDVPEKKTIAMVAAKYDLDVETLHRQRRKIRADDNAG